MTEEANKKEFCLVSLCPLLLTHLWSDSIAHSVFEVLSNNHGYDDAKGKCEEDEEDHKKGQNSHS